VRERRTDVKDLIAHAAQLGVSVHVAHIDGPQRGFYDSERKIVVYDFDLTPIERVCVLAHELGHAFYDHQCRGNASAEDDADYYAARLLIDPEAYAEAERFDPAQAAIADALGVEERLVWVFERRALTRVQGATYVRARLGRGQYAWRGFTRSATVAATHADFGA